MRRPLILAAAAFFLSSPAAMAATLCTMVAEAESGTELYRQGDCDLRVPPASTFKIAISLMGYDAGLLTDAHNPALPFLPGYPDYLPSWRATTDPTAWMKNSVVWYSQQITGRLGVENFRRYVVAFAYGNQDVSGNAGKNDGLTRSWLSSSLEISPAEQIDFLRKLVNGQLPVSVQAVAMTERLTTFDDIAGGWHLHGKTGTGAPAKADGSRDWDRAYGWFVGWATKAERKVVFARLIQDDGKQEISAGYRARDGLLHDLPALLNAR